jgi:hypothetical protein
MVARHEQHLPARQAGLPALYSGLLRGLETFVHRKLGLNSMVLELPTVARLA